MLDRARRNSNPTASQLPVNVRDTVVLSVAQGPNQKNNIEAKLLFRQGQSSFGLRAIGAAKLRTGRGEAQPNLECQAHYPGEGGDGAVIMVGSPHGVATTRALVQE